MSDIGGSEDDVGGYDNDIVFPSLPQPRPILVGYAFGPKKMSTMGLIMAEASKTKVVTGLASLSSTSPPAVAQEKLTADRLSRHNHFRSEASKEGADETSSHSSCDQKNDSAFSKNMDPASSTTTAGSVPTNQLFQDEANDSNQHYSNDYFHHQYNPQEKQQQQREEESVIFTLDGLYLQPQSSSRGGAPRSTGLEHIVRHFRSSCSSVADSASTGTCTASISASTVTSSGRSLTQPTASVQQSGGLVSSYTTMALPHQQPLRVSFVPLDLDQPLEEQHGGNMDLILHKLTEDILCVSILAKTTHPELQDLAQFADEKDLEQVIACPTKNKGDSDNIERVISAPDQASIRRVYRLVRFQRDFVGSGVQGSLQNHPAKLVVDDPVCVQTLMSRADIAITLQRCLRGVRSASGNLVDTPPFAVVDDRNQKNYYSQRDAKKADDVSNENSPSSSLSRKEMQVILDEAGLRFPIIVKPLTAAGTKASHAMAVTMDLDGLLSALGSKGSTNIQQPCLLQQYCNHDALLYKVYVLGDHVSVHKRRSLPNLPATTGPFAVPYSRNVVDFDSQRPYPRLTDFGFDEAAAAAAAAVQVTPRPMNGHSTPSVPVLPPKVQITVEQVQPIVDSLKAAFGLELFGFDILVTAASAVDEVGKTDSKHSDFSSEKGRKLLVVDVNYFPSYKEVSNFPALLAKYLTDKAAAAMTTRTDLTTE